MFKFFKRKPKTYIAKEIQSLVYTLKAEEDLERAIVSIDLNTDSELQSITLDLKADVEVVYQEVESSRVPSLGEELNLRYYGRYQYSNPEYIKCINTIKGPHYWQYQSSCNGVDKDPRQTIEVSITIEPADNLYSILKHLYAKSAFLTTNESAYKVQLQDFIKEQPVLRLYATSQQVLGGLLNRLTPEYIFGDATPYKDTIVQKFIKPPMLEIIKLLNSRGEDTNFKVHCSYNPEDCYIHIAKPREPCKMLGNEGSSITYKEETNIFFGNAFGLQGYRIPTAIFKDREKLHRIDASELEAQQLYKAYQYHLKNRTEKNLLKNREDLVEFFKPDSPN